MPGPDHENKENNFFPAIQGFIDKYVPQSLNKSSFLFRFFDPLSKKSQQEIKQKLNDCFVPTQTYSDQHTDAAAAFCDDNFWNAIEQHVSPDQKSKFNKLKEHHTKYNLFAHHTTQSLSQIQDKKLPALQYVVEKANQSFKRWGWLLKRVSKSAYTQRRKELTALNTAVKALDDMVEIGLSHRMPKTLNLLKNTDDVLFSLIGKLQSLVPDFFEQTDDAEIVKKQKQPCSALLDNKIEQYQASLEELTRNDSFTPTMAPDAWEKLCVFSQYLQDAPAINTLWQEKTQELMLALQDKWTRKMDFWAGSLHQQKLEPESIAQIKTWFSQSTQVLIAWQPDFSEAEKTKNIYQKLWDNYRRYKGQMTPEQADLIKAFLAKDQSVSLQEKQEGNAEHAKKEQRAQQGQNDSVWDAASQKRRDKRKQNPGRETSGARRALTFT